MSRGRLFDYAVYRPAYAALAVVVRTVNLVTGAKVTYFGLENMPKEGGAVFAINHTGYLDPSYSGLAAYKGGRKMRNMAKAEIFRKPLPRHFFGTLLGAIPVDRELGGAESLQAAIEVLRGGECVGVYPEATISRSFELKEFKSGAARMAIAAGVPIVPIVIWGSQRVASKGLPRGKRGDKPQVWVAVCEPIAPFEPAEAMTAELKKRMEERLRSLQAEYGPYPQGAAWVPRRLGGSAPTLEEANALDQAEAAARRARKLGAAD